MPVTSDEQVAGIDKGLIDILVVSDGSCGTDGTGTEEKVAAPRFYRKGQRKLRRAARTLSRRQKGSANRAKARVKLARVHRQVANKRQDFLHKQSIRLVRRYGAICIEDLSLKGMARTKHPGKSVNDAGLGMFRRMLEYKSEWYLSGI